MTDHRRPGGRSPDQRMLRGLFWKPSGGQGDGVLTVTGLDPKGLRSECGGFVQGVSSCNPQPVPNPFLMTMISTELG